MSVSKRRVLSVVGARPNIMKVAPVLRALESRSTQVDSILVHTGQHYDDAMSQIFLDELAVPAPSHVLGVGSGTHVQQIARVMERLEPVLGNEEPDLVLVAGDVNSTLAAALTAVKLELPVAHLEAGLRSFDRSMPEEVNRVVTDAISTLHLTHSPEARTNLLREGVDAASIHQVGNTMIDTLVAMRDRREVHESRARFGVDGPYLLVTLHRPALVDGPLLVEALDRLGEVSAELPVVFPVHPRTAHVLAASGLELPAGITALPPLGYFDFLGLLASATAVLTDSGGVQEETTVLGVPCFTLRDTTERPVTIESGTNTLLGLDPKRIAEIPELLRRPAPAATVPPGWDGQASVRVVDVLTRFLDAR
jgi:UDP-N-acetylglucosamine 2-epimerase (non-hydrolysing)